MSNIEEITTSSVKMRKTFFSPCEYHPDNFHFFVEDIFDAFDKNHFNIFVHQVNCRGVMGGGIARIVKQKFPFVFEQYQDRCKKPTHHLLGDVQLINISSFDEPKRMVCNLFAQNYYGVYTRQTDYEQFYRGLEQLKYELEEMEKDFPPNSEKLSVGFPYNIGCGLAGGDFRIVLSMIESVFGEKISNTDDLQKSRRVNFFILPDEFNKLMKS